MGTNTNNETYEANQREANNSTISGFDMRDKVEITDLSRKSHGIFRIHSSKHTDYTLPMKMVT